ncbi:MAG: membrane protein insertion efficiency factor YidD [Planctomycetaceae bacterium]|nr:MAG: membrane protein insertion efficiency factor YidD [Planctomycetaceae bacterium]
MARHREAESQRMLVKAAVFLIRCYQAGLSPLLGQSCRFSPTCSQYAIEVLRKDGLWRGSIRALRRISRCHPFHPGGYDPP